LAPDVRLKSFRGIEDAASDPHGLDLASILHVIEGADRDSKCISRLLSSEKCVRPLGRFSAAKSHYFVLKLLDFFLKTLNLLDKTTPKACILALRVIVIH
jgi:hypothetical protein